MENKPGHHAITDASKKILLAGRHHASACGEKK
jgi:hypothetical protein